MGEPNGPYRTATARSTSRSCDSERLVSSPPCRLDDPFVRLPDHVMLTPAEAGRLLEVLDIAAATARTEEERTAVREAVRMITAKLWPALGDLLDGDDEA